MITLVQIQKTMKPEISHTVLPHVTEAKEDVKDADRDWFVAK
jgi:hypothetical protein